MHEKNITKLVDVDVSVKRYISSSANFLRIPFLFFTKVFLVWTSVWDMHTSCVKPCQPEPGGGGRQTLFMGLKIPVRRDFIAETQKDNTQRCNIFPATQGTPLHAVKRERSLGCAVVVGPDFIAETQKSRV